MKKLFITALFFLNILTLFSQNPPEEFFNGLDLLEKNTKKAKKEFLVALQKDSLFHGTYHFLGVLSLGENEIDSAVTYFTKAVLLNTENSKHTQEMSYNRLIDAYLYNHDFKNAFNVAWEANQKYPDNKTLQLNLKDVCLWSFYINHNELDSAYLSSEVKDEYIVNSVSEEYLIVRKLRIDDHYLMVTSQALKSEKGASYDVLTCKLSKIDKNIDVKFRLNWDMGKHFGGKVADTDEVYSNKDLPVYERVGALYVKDSDINIEKEIKKVLKKEKKL